MHGVAGMLCLADSCAVVLVTQAKRVASLWGQPVYRITKTHLLVHQAINNNNSDRK